MAKARASSSRATTFAPSTSPGRSSPSPTSKAAASFWASKMTHHQRPGALRNRVLDHGTPPAFVETASASSIAGNRVRSHLDIVAPDDVRWDEVHSSLMEFIASCQRTALPWAGESGSGYFRLGMERTLSARWQRSWRSSIARLRRCGWRTRLERHRRTEPCRGPLPQPGQRRCVPLQASCCGGRCSPVWSSAFGGTTSSRASGPRQFVRRRGHRVASLDEGAQRADAI